jgi:tRNA-modifying protein YgfZ
VTAPGLTELAAEHAAAGRGAALIDLSDRGVLETTGPQRQKFLQGMLSNEVLNRPPGQGCLAALLTVKGHVQALLRVLIEKDAVLLEMPADRLELVERTLNHYKVAAPVRFKALPTAILGLIGPQAADVLGRAGAVVPDLPAEGHVRAAIAGRTGLLARASDLPGGGFVLHLSPEDATAVRDALLAAGAVPIGREVTDALRVESLRPWYGADVTEDNLLHETGLVSEYASFSKGCYIGQEVVARLDARGGHVNRALRGLTLSAPVPAGTTLTVEGKEVGRVTTAAVSPRRGPIALAYVHRSTLAAGTVLRAGDASATVVSAFSEAP